MKSTFTIIFLLLGLLCSLSSQAQQQSPPLERLVSINVYNMPLDEFLKELSKEGQFAFAYNPSVLNSQRRVTVNLKNKSVRYVLDAVFEGGLSYKTKANHVILSATNKRPEQKSPKYIKVTGYVIDRTTSARLSEVSIYEEKTLHSTLSDDFGYFTLQLPYATKDPVIRVEKRGYQDSIIYLFKKEQLSLEVAISPDAPAELSVEVPDRDTIIGSDTSTMITTVLIKEGDTLKTSSDAPSVDLWLVINRRLKAHLQNISDTLFRNLQFSVLPGLSTNKLLSGNVVNDYSINLLGGYSRGVRKLEMGTILNIDRSDVGKCQLSGMFNVVGGKVTGFQGAGLMNVVKDTVSGCQAAGLMNFNYRHTKGCQLAGLANHTRSIKGSQLAGLYNLSLDVKGVQLAGLFNTALTVKGSQVAGLFNFALDVEGAQVAGLFNVARNVRGTQIGFLNIADTCSGVPIGFLTIVRKGYHKLELATDEVLPYQVALRLGVHKFHNIFGASTNFKSGTGFVWAYSYGVGTSIKLHKKLYLDLDLVSSQINAEEYAPRLSLNNRINIGLDWQFAKKVSLAFGPSFNTYVVDNRLYSENNFYKTVGTNYPSLTYPNGGSNIDVRSWVGWKAAIRFF